MSHKKSFYHGYIEEDKSTLSQTKEDIRLDQLIPSEIFDDKDQLKLFLEKYYQYMNQDEFTYLETEIFTDIVLDNKAVFRVSDPEGSNDHFFTDETGGSSTLVVTDADNISTTIPLSSTNITISNGNELPGSLADSTSDIGKTFTVSGLSAHNTKSAKLTTPITYWVGPGPSYVLNEIERHLDIDENDQNYLELMQKEIAPIVPRNILVNKRTLYKQFIDFYKLRGTSDSIEIFFRILFNDDVEVSYPYDSTLIPSSGNWEVDSALPKGGIYLDKKGFLSDDIKIQDSLRYQKFSYVIKSGTNISDWDLVFNRLVHPAGFKYFAEILLLIQLINVETVNNRKTLPQVTPGTTLELLSAMPFQVPGVIGVEDVPLLVEAFASSFTPGVTANRGRAARFSLTLNNTGGVASIDIIDKGFGYLTAPTLTFNGEGSSVVAPVINLGALTADGEIEVDNITITSPGSGYTQLFVTASNPVDAQNNSVVGKIVSLKLHGLANKIFGTAPTIRFAEPEEVDALGNLIGTDAQATFSIAPNDVLYTAQEEADDLLLPEGLRVGAIEGQVKINKGEITGVNITNAGSGYIRDPQLFFTTGSQNEQRVKPEQFTRILNLNHTEVEDIITEVKVNPVQATGSILTSTGNPDKFLQEHRVKVVNPSYRTIIDNGYYERKGDEFFNSQRLYNMGYSIDFFGSQELQNVESAVINNYNTNSFIGT